MPCPVHQNLTGQSMQRWLLLCLLITLLDSFHLLEERKSPRFFPLVLNPSYQVPNEVLFLTFKEYRGYD